MAKKESRSGGYEALRAAVKAGVPANLYIFYGEERYLLQTMAQRLKELLIPAGFEEFNYHRLTGKGLTVQELAETAEAMPMMAEHTLITVTDMDIFKLDEGQRTALIDLLSDFPPYCTLIFLYEQLTYKRDGKMKKLCARAGVDAGKVFPHNLRHLFATAFYRAYKDIVKLADVLGHSSIETTRIYLVTSMAEHRRQLEQLKLVS
mgnify:CR=1 FL=1